MRSMIIGAREKKQGGELKTRAESVETSTFNRTARE